MYFPSQAKQPENPYHYWVGNISRGIRLPVDSDDFQLVHLQLCVSTILPGCWGPHNGFITPLCPNIPACGLSHSKLVCLLPLSGITRSSLKENDLATVVVHSL